MEEHFRKLLDDTDGIGIDTGVHLVGYGPMPISVSGFRLVSVYGPGVDLITGTVQFVVRARGAITHLEKTVEGVGMINAFDQAIMNTVREQFGDDIAGGMFPARFNATGDCEKDETGTRVPAGVLFGFRGTVYPGGRHRPSHPVTWQSRAKDNDTVKAAMHALLEGYNFWIIMNSPANAYRVSPAPGELPT